MAVTKLDLPVPKELGVIVGQEGWRRLLARVADLREEELASEAWPHPHGGSHVQFVLVRGRQEVFVMMRETPTAPPSLEDLVRAFSLLSHGSDLVVVTDNRGYLLSASALWREFYGFSMADVLGQNPRVINSRQHPPSLFHAMWQALTNRSIGTWSGELVNRRCDGQLVHVWQTITAVRDREGGIVGYLGQTRDMTAHHESRRQLACSLDDGEQASRGAAKLLSTSALDLRSLLQLIVGYASLVKEHHEFLSKPRILDYVAEIGEAGNRMLDLVQSLSSRQQIENDRLTLRLRRAHLVAMVSSLIDVHAAQIRSRGVRIEFTKACAALPLFLDITKFDHILNSVLSRAVRRAPDGSLVQVLLRSDEAGTHTLVVTDQGPPASEPAWQSVIASAPVVASQPIALSAGDSPWDLSVATHLLQLHGGRIEETARPDGGNEIALSFSSGLAHFCQEVWAGIAYDPHHRICGEVMDGLERLGIVRFLAQSPEELAVLCERELPNLVLVEESVASGLTIPPLGATQALAALRPAEVVVGRRADGELRFAWRAGDPHLQQPTGKLLEAFRTLTRRARPVGAERDQEAMR